MGKVGVIDEKIAWKLTVGSDGIWGDVDDYGEQEAEKPSHSVASKVYSDYLDDIRMHHSIPVMDREIEKFLSQIPHGGVVLGIGGCWGWHGRKADIQRPDITVVIVDLVRENLLHANEVLKDQVANQKVFLVHGNACALEFEDDAFDGVWSVQTTQHIPDFGLSCPEIYRV